MFHGSQGRTPGSMGICGWFLAGAESASMRTFQQTVFGGTLFLSFVLLPSSLAAQAIPDEMAELKRITEALQAGVAALQAQAATLQADNEALRAQNAALENRLAILEAEEAEREASPQRQSATAVVDPGLKEPGAPDTAPREGPTEREMAAQDAPAKAAAEAGRSGEPDDVASQEDADLERRVTEIETAIWGQETATRSIIRDALTSIGSNINEIVGFGGNMEFSGGVNSDFDGKSEGFLGVTTAEIAFDIVPNEWTLGSLIFELDDGSNNPLAQPGTSSQTNVAIQDAFVTVGNPLLFPPFLTVGQFTLPFGISTGDPVADILTIEDPLTIEAFEQRQVAVGLGAAFPTPEPAPPSPPVTVPKVQPQVLNPLISYLSSALGYRAPGFPPPQTELRAATQPAPQFNAGVYFYDGDTFDGPSKSGFSPDDHIDATVGYRTSGHCGRPYDQISQWDFCPWTLDVDVDFNSSVFDSLFLSRSYSPFLSEIGIVPGLAASIKTSFGPVSFVGEWNGAISSATFTDGLGNDVNIQPSAWQMSAAYQFDWNPWVEAIGTQGTFVALTYSESHDLAGVADDDGGRVGDVPRQRLTLNASEWVLDNLKIALEYSHNWDYSVSAGGTGKSGDTVSGTLTFVW